MFGKFLSKKKIDLATKKVEKFTKSNCNRYVNKYLTYKHLVNLGLILVSGN